MLAAVFGDPVLTGGDSPSCFLEMPPRDFFFFLAAYSRWLIGLVRDGSFGLIGYYAYLHLFAMASLAYSLWLIWLSRDGFFGSFASRGKRRRLVAITFRDRLFFCGGKSAPEILAAGASHGYAE